MDSPSEPKAGSSSSPAADVVEYKKDGSVSRMRSHKGNVPQLPQTKLCPFCPAKFTRTTHLNRHLRNHTNERMYRCETCGAQFTRSDLLARHKRSCGDAHPISRTRRRSCQACAGLKVKCDLRSPCSKCIQRGRECVYGGEGETTMPLRRSASPARRRGSSSEQHAQGTPPAPTASGSQPTQSQQPTPNIDGTATWSLSSFPDDFSSSAFPELGLMDTGMSNDHSSSQPLNAENLAQFGSMLPPPVPRASSPMSHARSLPNYNFENWDIASSETLSSFAPSQHAFTSFGGPTGLANLGSFSNDMFEPFFRDVFGLSSIQENAQEGLGANGDDLSMDQILSRDPQLHPVVDSFIFSGDANSQPLDDQLMHDMMVNTYPTPPEAEGLDSMASFTTGASTSQEPQQPAPPPPAPQQQQPPPQRESPVQQAQPEPPTTAYPTPENSLPTPPSSIPEEVPEPTTEELQQYLYIFLTQFLPQLPIVHTPSLRVELKPPILLRAMQACGALFVKTKTAEAFVTKVLANSRDTLVGEFSKASPDPKHRLHIIMTIVFLQTIGLFHQNPEQRASSSLYHGMVVLMIRQTGIVERNANWTQKDWRVTDPEELRAAWIDWAAYESIKRVMLLSYNHDQAHPIYFSLPASFRSSEFVGYLPSDEAIWTAPSPEAWQRLVMSPSPYGTGEERLRGVSMQKALSAIGIENDKLSNATVGLDAPPKDLGIISPFGHFILIQAILAMLCQLCKSSPVGASRGQVGCGANNSDGMPPVAVPAGEEVNENVFVVQLALHRWLRIWLQNPEATRTPNIPQSSSSTATTTSGLAGSASQGKKSGDAPFFGDPLPFYWLSQLLLLAFQEQLPPFAPKKKEGPPPHNPLKITSFCVGVSEPEPLLHHDPPSHNSSSPPVPRLHASPEFVSPMYYRAPHLAPTPQGPQAQSSISQFTLVKSWLHHIRLFLKKSEGSATVVWDELMKIRLRGWEADAAGLGVAKDRSGVTGRGDESVNGEGGSVNGEFTYEEHGLLGFFEEVDQKLRI